MEHSQPDKLLNIEEAENLYRKFSNEDTKAHYKQLANIMRENERLLGHIRLAIENIDSEDFLYARHTLEESLSNKACLSA